MDNASEVIKAIAAGFWDEDINDEEMYIRAFLNCYFTISAIQNIFKLILT